VLNPILVMGLGRSGTTAMMSFLGTDATVAFDRVAAFENRQLSYLAKFSLLVNRRLTLPEFEEYKLRDLDESVFGPPPWFPGGFFPDPATIDFFPALWETFSKTVAASGSIRFYAEKAPTWMNTFVAAYVNPFSIRLFRDPRDNFLSALAFMRKRGNMVGFGRALNDSDEKFARTICYRWINFHEAWMMTAADTRSLMVRYEDFVADPESIASMLKQRLDLNLDSGKIHVGEHHRTAITVKDSVARHRAELAPELLNLFGEYLGEEMAALGYADAPLPRFKKFYFNDLTSLTSSADGRLNPAGDRTTVEVTGADFYVHLPVANFEAGGVHGLWVAACAPLGDHCSVYWRRAGEFFSEERVIHCRYFPGGQWRVFQFEFTGHALWQGEIAELRLDLFNFRERMTPGTGEISWFRLISRG
jgi:Sulfotransferase family